MDNNYIEKQIMLQHPKAKFLKVYEDFIHYTFDVVVTTDSREKSRLGYEIKIPLSHNKGWYKEIDVTQYRKYIDLSHVYYFVYDKK